MNREKGEVALLRIGGEAKFVNDVGRSKICMGVGQAVTNIGSSTEGTVYLERLWND